MKDDREWRLWALYNLERGCEHEGVASLLEENGYGHLIDELQLNVAESDESKEASQVPDYEFALSAKIVPEIDGKMFDRIESDKLELFICREFLSPDHCEKLCKIIREIAIPSTVTVENGDPAMRTSQTSHLSQLKSNLLTELDQKISEAIGINPSYSEGIQGQLYDVGNEFKPHTDYFSPNSQEYSEHATERGQRTWTFMIYLNDGVEGGETYFPRIDRAFTPKQGTALAWNNLRGDGTPNPDTLHHGRPVLRGRKCIITKWFRTKGKGHPFTRPVDYNNSSRQAKATADTPPVVAPAKIDAILDRCLTAAKAGDSVEELENVMRESGISSEISATLARSLHKPKLGSTTSSLSNRISKYEWMLSTFTRLEAISNCSPIIEIEELNAEHFRNEFYSKNRPFILRNFLKGRKLKEVLSWPRLTREFGDREVEVQGRRESNANYERNASQHKMVIRFRDYLAGVVEGGESNNQYMTANNGNTNRDLIEEILDGVDVCPELLATERRKGNTFLWIGAKGTITPLHHDLTNNLMIQVSGMKEIKLISPSCYPYVYNDRHCYSQVDIYNINHERFPEFVNAKVHDVELRQGDLLFLPICWWHAVKALSPSITVTATNFRFRNDFAKYHRFLDNML